MPRSIVESARVGSRSVIVIRVRLSAQLIASAVSWNRQYGPDSAHMSRKGLQMAEISEGAIKYWSSLSPEELEETRQDLQKELDSGCHRHGETQKWIDEIDTVLESRKAQQAS